jgi:outer membrane protein TolC
MSFASRSALALGAFLAAVPIGAAQELPDRPTLQDFLRLAEERSPALRASERAWRAEAEAARAAGSLPDPRVSFGWFGEEVQTRVGPQEQRLGLQQRLPWFGTLSLADEAARLGVEAAAQRHESARLALRRSVVEAWADLVHRQAEARLLTEDVARLEDLVAVADERYRSSTASLGDVVRLRVETELVRTRLAAAEDRRAALGARLNAWLDRPADAPLPDSLPARELPTAPDPAGAGARVTDDSPRLAERTWQVEQARASSALASRTRWPDLTVGVDWIRTGEALDPTMPGSGKDPWMVSVGLELPLFRGKHDGPAAAARARVEAAEARRATEAAELDARAELALAAWRDADRRVVLYRDRLTPEMESLLESTWTAYVNGSAGIADVVDVQRTSLELRLAEADAHRDRAYALGDLTRVTGVDWLHAEETP